MITKEAIEVALNAYYGNDVEHGRLAIAQMEAALTAAFAAMPGPAGRRSFVMTGCTFHPDEATVVAYINEASACSTDLASETAQCCMCGKLGLSTTEGDGGTECELTDGRWVCSAECWDRAITPAADLTSENERLRAALKGVREAIFELKFALFSSDMTIKDRADQSARLALAALERT